VTYNVAFGNLYQACQKNALHARLHTWDGGQTIYITSGSANPVFQWSSDWRDDIDPVNQAAEWLIEQGYIKAQDLEG